MARAVTQWDSQIGRRLRLRDLHIFSLAAHHGSMAKAARALRITQPAVSKVVAELEHTLGVRLLERGARGVEPTMYGRVLLARSSTAFDELRQGVRDIEFLADPGAGEVRIECQESIAAAILPAVIHRFSQTYPRVVLHVEHLGSLRAESRALQERTIDVAIYRFAKPDIEKRDDLNVELLFNDELVAVAGAKSRWVGRR